MDALHWQIFWQAHLGARSYMRLSTLGACSEHSIKTCTSPVQQNPVRALAETLRFMVFTVYMVDVYTLDSGT